MQDVKTGDLSATQKMQTFLRCLEEGTRSCPLIQRSLDIITNNLGSNVSDPTPQAAPEAPMPDEAVAPASYLLPAFPYQAGDVNFAAELGDAPMNLDGISYLDAFPEAQYTNFSTDGTWFYSAM